MKKQNVRTLSFIVSTFTYLLFGAAIFDALESQTEDLVKQDLDRTERDYKSRYNISNHEYRDLEEVVIKYHPYHIYPQWKFTGAFYFSLTVITTIGYGHSTPQTILGKTFCMFYAIVGIPLCLIMFQSVGERLNYFASFCIKIVKKFVRVRQTEVNQTEMVCVAGVFAIVVITGGAAMFSHYEGWTYFNSIYYCVITLTTIGFGDFVALQDGNNLSNTKYVILSFTFILFGLTVVASSINLFVLKFLTMNTDDERREEYTRTQATVSASHALLTQDMRFSNSDLLNAVNGEHLYSLDPEKLEELQQENNLNLSWTPCSPNTLIVKILHRIFPCLKLDSYLNAQKTRRNANRFHFMNGRPSYDFMLNREGIQLGNDGEIVASEASKKLNASSSSSRTTKCAACLRSMRPRKKSHYTVQRGPTRIGHLLVPNNSVVNSKIFNEPIKFDEEESVLTSDNDKEAINSTENFRVVIRNEQNNLNDINEYIDEGDLDLQGCSLKRDLVAEIGNQNMISNMNLLNTENLNKKYSTSDLNSCSRNEATTDYDSLSNEEFSVMDNNNNYKNDLEIINYDNNTRDEKSFNIVI